MVQYLFFCNYCLSVSFMHIPWIFTISTMIMPYVIYEYLALTHLYSLPRTSRAFTPGPSPSPIATLSLDNRSLDNRSIHTWPISLVVILSPIVTLSPWQQEHSHLVLAPVTTFSPGHQEHSHLVLALALVILSPRQQEHSHMALALAQLQSLAIDNRSIHTWP